MDVHKASNTIQLYLIFFKVAMPSNQNKIVKTCICFHLIGKYERFFIWPNKQKTTWNISSAPYGIYLIKTYDHISSRYTLRFFNVKNINLQVQIRFDKKTSTYIWRQLCHLYMLRLVTQDRAWRHNSFVSLNDLILLIPRVGKIRNVCVNNSWPNLLCSVCSAWY